LSAGRLRPDRTPLMRLMWMRNEGGSVFPGRLIRHAIVGWTRLHGVLSLELEGHFAFGLPDPALIYDSEVEALVQELIDLEQSSNQAPGVA
jgi:hypothetical protein